MLCRDRAAACGPVESTLAHLEARDSFGTISAHLHVRSDGPGPKLGLG